MSHYHKRQGAIAGICDLGRSDGRTSCMVSLARIPGAGMLNTVFSGVVYVRCWLPAEYKRRLQ